MARAFSLRGTIQIDDNAVMATPQSIFAYESPNRTKAWRITGAWVWPPYRGCGDRDVRLAGVGPSVLS